jgi:hypothetical protein
VGAAVLTVAGSAAISSAAVAPTFRHVKGVFNLYAVSCPSRGPCVAAGDSLFRFGGTEGALVTIRGGVPSRTVRVPSVFNFSGIACHRAGRCVAVGQSPKKTTAVIVSVVNGRPRRIRMLPKTFLFGIACPAPRSCWATGETARYTHAVVAHVVGGAVRHVSRLRDIYPGAFHDVTSVPLTAAAPFGPPPACWSATSCLAVGGIGHRDPRGLGKSDRAGLIVTLRNGRVHKAVRVSATGHLSGVDCASPRTCVATGEARGGFNPAHPKVGKLIEITAGRPTGILLSEVGNRSLTQPVGVSCATRTRCYAIAAAGEIEAVTRGRPTAIRAAPGGGGLSGISCAAKACLAVGGESPGPNREVGTVYRFPPF